MIHKADIPLTPMVSYMNSFAYDLSSHLANILSLLRGNSDFMVFNLAHFLSIIIGKMILKREFIWFRIVYKHSNQHSCTSLLGKNWRMIQAYPSAWHKYLVKSWTSWTLYWDWHSSSTMDQFMKRHHSYKRTGWTHYHQHIQHMIQTIGNQ